MSHPVEGARVTLISNAYPYGWEKSREVMQTDDRGIAKFESRKEWRIEAIMLHGAEFYFWNWCVEKSGFVTYVSANHSAGEFSSEPTIVLTQGISTPCPTPYR